MNTLLSIAITCSLLFCYGPLDAAPKAASKAASRATSKATSKTKKNKHCLPVLLPTPSVKQAQVPSLPDQATSHIILDPGHGGEDDGAKSLVNPYIARKISISSRPVLLNSNSRKRDMFPILTSEKDLFVSLMDRAAMPELC